MWILCVNSTCLMDAFQIIGPMLEFWLLNRKVQTFFVINLIVWYSAQNIYKICFSDDVCFHEIITIHNFISDAQLNQMDFEVIAMVASCTVDHLCSSFVSKTY